MSVKCTDLLSSAAYTLLRRELGAKECDALPGRNPFEKLEALSRSLATILPAHIADLRYGFYNDANFLERVKWIKICREALFLGISIDSQDLSTAEAILAEANETRLSLARNDGLVSTNRDEIRAKNIRLTRVPQSLFKFSHVLILNLSGNHIEVLPRGLFQSMQKIIFLHLQDNTILQLSSDIFTPLTELMFLDLSNNHLESLPQGLFANLTKLETVKLSGNLLPAESFNNLPPIKNLEK